MISEDNRISSREQLDEWLNIELPSYKIGGGVLRFSIRRKKAVT